MNITYLGHAGFVIEAGSTRILVDPWFYPAFLDSWFPAPDNRFLLEEVADLRFDLVFVSHGHEDHFDRTFLDRVARDTPVLCAKYLSRGLLSSWRALGFSDITLVDHGDSITVAPGVVATVLCDTSHREDSALMLDVDGFTFLDLNDCLVQFGELPAGVDILTRQFSGAMWYPNCYRYPPDVLARKVSTVRRNLLQTLVTTCAATTPRWYLPSAGPACFLDPELQQFNDRNATIFPAWEDVADGFAAACPSVDVLRPMPGDRIEVRGGVPRLVERNDPARATDTDLASYSAARVNEYSALRNLSKPPVTSDELRAHLVEHQRKSKPLLEDCNKRVRISTEQRAWTFTLRAEPEIELIESAPDPQSENPPAEYSFEMPEWVLREIVERDSWEEALLSMRITLTRDPDEFDVRLLGFLRYGHMRPVVQRLVSDIKSSDETIERDGLRLQRFCPHSGEDLTHAIICDGIVECPRHHWKWDAASGTCIEGGTLPLRVEPIERAGEEPHKEPVA